MRYLLLSVPYRKQLNFTFDGLQGATATVERLRQFRRLVAEAKTAEDANENVKVSVEKSLADFETALDDDLNTAVALAAIHNLVREINSILADGKLSENDKQAVLEAVEKFDAVLGIFGKEERRKCSMRKSKILSKSVKARRQRNFARSDEIRDLLVEKGIILEDTKDGVRWKRK